MQRVLEVATLTAALLACAPVSAQDAGSSGAQPAQVVPVAPGSAAVAPEPVVPEVEAGAALPGPSADGRKKHLLGVGGSFGTIGAGVNATYVVNPHWAARAQFNGFDFQDTLNYHQTNYDSDFRFLSLGLLGDWYPLAWTPIWGKFRLTAGTYANFTHIGLNANCISNGSGCNVGQIFIEQPGLPGAPPGTLAANIRFNKFSPYAGIGVGQTLPGGRIQIAFDAGALFEGKPKFDLHASGVATVYNEPGEQPNPQPENLAADPVVQTNVGYEQGGIESRVSHFQIFPVFYLTVGYWFKI